MGHKLSRCYWVWISKWIYRSREFAHLFYSSACLWNKYPLEVFFSLSFAPSWKIPADIPGSHPGQDIWASCPKLSCLQDTEHWERPIYAISNPKICWLWENLGLLISFGVLWFLPALGAGGASSCCGISQGGWEERPWLVCASGSVTQTIPGPTNSSAPGISKFSLKAYSSRG